jgi:organic hydroperoxide reductase OsmC/OhrA
MEEMSQYLATIVWTRAPDAPFRDNKYSRAHEWHFDGGAVVKGSSAPSSVRVPLSDPTAVDPEEALVASLSSCHMLFFLSFAASAGFVIDRYEDEAVGEMGKNAKGKTAIVKVTLRPRIAWIGDAPSAEKLNELHHRSHDACYIANSVSADVLVEQR